MNKNIGFKADQNHFIISVNGNEKFKISKEIRTLNAKDIYDILDYSLGDTYTYDEIENVGKDALVLSKIKDLFEQITNKIIEISFSENDTSLKNKLDNINNENLE
ncbi:hypothetical protein [Sharpea azabuensis]|uniref:hypothetical protein n=1 Tax=Sharpea azabuensis TaxID=322505 RepID=UPI00051BE5B4|nr:hypothetical protein [Sharpea azabuensis]